MKIRSRLLIVTSVVMTIAVFMFSCKSGTSGEKADTDKQETDKIETFKNEVSKVSPNMRNISDIAVLLETAGVDYVPSLVNDPSNVDQYMVSPEMVGLHLGMYISDVVYSISYNQTEAAQGSLDAAVDLADYLGLGDVFAYFFVARFVADDLSTNDSIVDQMHSAFEKVEEVLSGKDQARIALAILGGNFIEKQYMLHYIIHEYPGEDIPDDVKLLMLRNLLVIVTSQEEAFKTFVDLIDRYSTEETNIFLLPKIKRITALYASMTIEENIQEISSDQIFKNEKLLEIKAIITEIREDFIAGKI